MVDVEGVLVPQEELGVGPGERDMVEGNMKHSTDGHSELTS